jgi:Saxitoxin biosynthesis operon protein SxtJ
MELVEGGQIMLSPQRATSDPEHVSFDAPRGSSDRNFGLTFGIFFLVLGLWPIVRGDSIRVWSLIVAALLFGVAFFSPHLFAVPNRLWFRFGLVLGKFLTPIIVVVLFLVAILPVALILRILGKDILGLHADPTLETYWVPRESRGLTPESLNDQF